VDTGTFSFGVIVSDLSIDDADEFCHAVDADPVLIHLCYPVKLSSEFRHIDDYTAYVLKEGAELAQTMMAHLPENVFDAMLMTLLELKASTLVTRHGQRTTPPRADGQTD